MTGTNRYNTASPDFNGTLFGNRANGSNANFKIMELMTGEFGPYNFTTTQGQTVYPAYAKGKWIVSNEAPYVIVGGDLDGETANKLDYLVCDGTRFYLLSNEDYENILTQNNNFEGDNVFSGDTTTFNGATVDMSETAVLISDSEPTLSGSPVPKAVLDIERGRISDLEDKTTKLGADGNFDVVVSGVTPTEDANLATKGYVDGEVEKIASDFLGNIAYNSAEPSALQSGYYVFTNGGETGAWFAGRTVTANSRAYLIATPKTWSYVPYEAIAAGAVTRGTSNVDADLTELEKLLSNRNQLKNSRFLFFSESGDQVKTYNQAGSPEYSIEESLFATNQMRINCSIGDRFHLTSGVTIESGCTYSAGFFYKIISGTKKPFIYDISFFAVGAISSGIVTETVLNDGWVFYARENCVASADYVNANQGFLIDYNNVGGSEDCECIIAMPMLVQGVGIPPTVLHGYDTAFNYIKEKFESVDAEMSNVNGDNWNLFVDSGMFLVDSLSGGIVTENRTGISSFEYENNVFGGTQTRITSPAGARAHLIAPFNVDGSGSYSFGFYYKVIAGTIVPLNAESIISQIPGNTSIGTVSVVDVADGWKFYKRENITFNQSSQNPTGLYIVFNNTAGLVEAETLIALPLLIKGETISPRYPDGTFYGLSNVISRINNIESSFTINDWYLKNIALYGDSITAICNGDFVSGGFDDNTWGGILAKYIGAAKLYARGVGAQAYRWGTNGGSVTFVNQITGQFNSRNDAYNYDNYTGAIPSGTIKVRGAFGAWNRITGMFPASIKDSINCVIVKGGTNDGTDQTALDWVENDTTDVEWAASSYYSTYNGDFNITSLKGGIASTIMKMQAWMPNAIIILATPLSGIGTTGQLNFNFTESIQSGCVRDVARILSIPLIDVNANCGINGLNRTTYITDNVHPYSLAGNKMLARTVIAGIKQVLPNI